MADGRQGREDGYRTQSSNSAAVFPDLQQGYASLYPFTSATGQPLNLSPAERTLVAAPHAHSTQPSASHEPRMAQMPAVTASHLLSSKQHSQSMEYSSRQHVQPSTADLKTSNALRLKTQKPPTKTEMLQRQVQMFALAQKGLVSPNQTSSSQRKPNIGPMGHGIPEHMSHNNSNQILMQPSHPKQKTGYPTILPSCGSKAKSSAGVALGPPGQSHVASASPAIHAALNQPVIDRGSNRAVILQTEMTVNSASNTQSPSAPATFHQPHHNFMPDGRSQHMPTKQTGPFQAPHWAAVAKQQYKAAKQQRQRASKSDHPTNKSAHKGAPKSDHPSNKSAHKGGQLPNLLPATSTSQDRFLSTNQISGMPVNFVNIQGAGNKAVQGQYNPVSAAFYQKMLPQTLDARTILSSAGKLASLQSTAAGPLIIPAVVTPVAPKQPPGPRSIIQSRLYKKRKQASQKSWAGLSQQISDPAAHITGIPATSVFTAGSLSMPPVVTDGPAAVKVSPAKAAGKSNRLPTDRVPDFDWTLYLKHIKAKAVAHSAFKHVECSLQNGFMIGMKVETPLRDADNDKYWLATIIAVYGPLLKLRFDGYGDKSKDFFMKSSSGKLHPIGWCSRNNKSLLPPADIRHTQKQWKSFLLNALQGAKTVPNYLLSTHSGPWVADRIRQSMRLEVQHENVPTAVWVAKVIRNVGGRVKLRYEGSIDDTTDFWLFYQDRRIHPCGWAAGSGCIYRPPDEIKDSFEYDVWSKILQEVTRDSTIDRIPTEIFQVPLEIASHELKPGQVLEVVHPSGAYISPAGVSAVINNKYFILEMLTSSGPSHFTTLSYTGDPTLLPAGWCEQQGITLGKPPQQGEKGFSWAQYFRLTKVIPAKDSFLLNQQVPLHQFAVGQMLEAVNPINPNQICVSKISKIVGRLMWLEMWTTPSVKSTSVIVDVSSQAIFPVGWCESNNYPLTAPKVDLSEEFHALNKPRKTEVKVQDENSDTIFFNTTCFTGPFLSKGRVQELPNSIGPGPVRTVGKDMVSAIVNAGYKSSYILKILQKNPDDPKNTAMCEETIKARYKGKVTEGLVEICTKPSGLSSLCKLVCSKLKCCTNLVSIRKLTSQCSEKCHLQTKTQFLCVDGRKPGRPSSTNPDGSKRKKRKNRKKSYKKRNLLSGKSADAVGDLADLDSAAVSDNNSVCSSDYDSQSPPPGSALSMGDRGLSKSPVRRISPTPRPRTNTAERDNTVQADSHPLFQLQLASVKKNTGGIPGGAAAALAAAAAVEAAQYEVVKRKRGRPANKPPDPSLRLSIGSHPVVPPLKIRRLDLSPTQTKNGFGGPSDAENSVTRRILPSSLINGHSGASGSQSNAAPQPHSSGGGGLLKTTTPHAMVKSALTYSQPRLHIDDSEKVILTDNPLYWDVSRLVEFIQQTDCAYLADKLSEQEIDGQAFMLMVLPTVQEELDLKLGPALKLCHHVQRLKLAFYESFHPDETMRHIRQED